MNKFAKYVPEADKKKQREHIGAVGMNDLPFGTEITGWEITWDGNTEGLVSVSTPDGSNYCKVSDLTPDLDSLLGGTFTLIDDGETTLFELTENRIQSIKDNEFVPGQFAILAETIIIIYQPCSLDGNEFPEAGVYFAEYDQSVYVSSLSTKKEIVRTIDPKYLPDKNLVITAYMEEERFTSNMSYEEACSALYDGATITFIKVAGDGETDLAFVDGVRFRDPSKFSIVINNDVVGIWTIDFKSDNTLVLPGPM